MFKATLCALFTVMCLAAPSWSVDLEVLRDRSSDRVFALRVSEDTADKSLSAAASNASPREAAAAFIAANKAVIGLSNPAAQLRAGRLVSDREGTTHVSFLQQHSGLPVLGAEVRVHFDKDGDIYYANTKVARDLPPSTTPTIDEQQARELALDRAAALTTHPCNAESARLVVLPLGLVRNLAREDTRLAWEVYVADRGENDNYSSRHYVDAHSGESLMEISNIAALDRKVYDCSWPNYASCIIDYCDYLHYTTPPYNYCFGRSESATARGPCPVAAPVFHGSNDVDSSFTLVGAAHMYWQREFGIDGANGEGGTGIAPLRLESETRVVVLIDEDYDGCPSFAYYDYIYGKVGFCVGMVTPDVIGHEYGHAVIKHATLDSLGIALPTFYYGETGALHEAFADLAGVALEQDVTGLRDWKLGTWQSNPAGVYPSASSGLIRDAADPGGLFEPFTGTFYPDRTYSPSIYCGEADNAGVHFNATIMSHAYYLMAEGGTLGECQVNAIGFDAVMRIAFRALRTYYTNTVTFNEAYAAMIQAATDLYPAPVVAAVRTALQAAQLDQPGLCSGIPEQVPACAGLSSVRNDLVSPAEGSSIRFCGPNPSIGPATIEYALARGGHVEVTVHDMAGRLVSRLESTYLDRGIHQATWRDPRVASGHYFLRVTIDGALIGTERIAMIR